MAYIFVFIVLFLCLDGNDYDVSVRILECISAFSSVPFVVAILNSCCNDLQYLCMAQRISMAALHAVAGSACNHLLLVS